MRTGRVLKILYINLGDNVAYTYDKLAGRILGWASEGNSVTILTAQLSKLTIKREIVQNDPIHIQIVVLPFSNKSTNGALGIIFAYLLRIFFSFMVLFESNSEFDFAFSNSPFLVDIMPVLWLRLFGRCRRWVLMMDSVVPSPKKKSGNYLVNSLTYVESLLVGKAANLFSEIIFTVNPELKRAMLERGIKNDKIYVSQNGLFLDVIGPVKKSKICRYAAVYMGRVSVNKGVLDLIRVWKKVTEKIPSAKLAIMGSGMGSVVENFRREIDESGLKNNIDYLGFIPGAKKYEVLKNSKVFLYLSKVNADESWGISLMEGLGCGLPAISYNLPIYGYIYKTKSLIRVDCYNTDVVAEKVIYLLENNRARLVLSKKARNFAYHFDWAKIAKEDLLNIKRVIGN